jgi:hypothetical protein
MKKVLIIPDVHGRDYWKSHVEESVDAIVFLGDLFDSFTIDRKTQIKNFEDIISFKKTYSDKVTLLYGNHDLHYLKDAPTRGSGWTADFAPVANVLMEDNKHLFKPLHQIGKTLFSHAGISEDWLFANSYTIQNVLEKFEIGENLEELVNILFNSSYADILFQIGRLRGGSCAIGGPFWADAREYNETNILSGYDQYVGHTSGKNNPSSKITRNKNENGSIVFCDCWDFKNIKQIVEVRDEF